MQDISCVREVSREIKTCIGINTGGLGVSRPSYFWMDGSLGVVMKYYYHVVQEHGMSTLSKW